MVQVKKDMCNTILQSRLPRISNPSKMQKFITAQNFIGHSRFRGEIRTLI